MTLFYKTMVFLLTFTLHIICFLLLSVNGGFLLSSFMSSKNNKHHFFHNAKPKRFEDNADGILYVNDDVSYMVQS